MHIRKIKAIFLETSKRYFEEQSHTYTIRYVSGSSNHYGSLSADRGGA